MSIFIWKLPPWSIIYWGMIGRHVGDGHMLFTLSIRERVIVVILFVRNSGFGGRSITTVETGMNVKMII